MIFLVEAFFSGCISKLVNDGTDYSKSTIQDVICDKKNQDFSTKIYRVIEKALNVATYNKYKNRDILYDAAEKLFLNFKENGDSIEAVKACLSKIIPDVDRITCEKFMKNFYDGICQDADLYKVISLMLQEKGIQINQEGFKKLDEKIDNLTATVSNRNDKKINLQNKEPIKSRTQEYADKWNDNMFLNDFNEWDENTGVNVKLKEVYLKKHLPRFVWKNNKKESGKLEELLLQYTTKNNKNKMLLILGQPAIGKSTLLTWIAVNFKGIIDDILIYQFASDLKNIEWQENNINKKIVKALGLSFGELNNKILILDGFDEVAMADAIRGDILNDLYDNLIYKKNIENFILIITCRENYINKLNQLKCDYITLCSWNKSQIRSFCNVFQKKTGKCISKYTLKNILDNKAVLGIPLILYMVLALDISFEKESSIVDVYDKIFSINGGIYDRCINNKNFAAAHRIAAIKRQIHQISREIAFWMFENNSNETYILQENYIKICDSIIKEQGNEEQNIKSDFKIGNFFKLVRHCEGIESERLYFVHRTIYEYFVADFIFSSIEDDLLELTEERKEYFAEHIAICLKKGEITPTIGEYLHHKVIKLYNNLNIEKRKIFYKWLESAVEKMMEDGMFYYTKTNIYNLKKIISKECRCFMNLIEILRLLQELNDEKNIINFANNNLIDYYVRFCISVNYYMETTIIENTNLDEIIPNRMNLYNINLSNINLNRIDLNRMNLGGINFNGTSLKDADFSDCDLSNSTFHGANLKNIDLRNSNLSHANLILADLRGAKLWGADLGMANLIGANLRGAKLWGANLKGADLLGADLRQAVVDEYQISYLEDTCDLRKSKVFIFNSVEIISYEDYCQKRNDNLSSI